MSRVRQSVLRRSAGTLAVLIAMFSPWQDRSLHAYVVHDNWCDKFDLAYDSNSTSFASRGFPSGVPDSHMRTAATWWSDAQVGLRLKYNSTTTSTDDGDPAPVFAACGSEDQYFIDNSGAKAYAHWDYYWYPSCDFTGVNITRTRIGVRSDIDNASCGTSGWGYTIADLRAGKSALYKLIAHEFGHIQGLEHDCNLDGTSLMCNSAGTMRQLTYDDGNGLVDPIAQGGAGEGKDSRQLATSVGTRSGGVINFINLQTLTPYAMWKPAISGNGGASPAWDYALAWVDSASYEIKVATASDSANDTLTLGTIRSTGYHTRNAPSIAVGDSNRIGIAWTDSDLNTRTVRFASSSDGGQSWTLSTITGYGAIGAVNLTYAWQSSRWVMTWLHRGCGTSTECGGGTPYSHRIVTLVSSNSAGSSWTNPKKTYSDTLTMPNLAPAITCSRAGANECLLVYRSYAVEQIRTIRQQAFSMNANQTELATLPTSAETGNYGYSDLSIARISGGYIFTYVEPTTANSRLNYRIKSDAAGVGYAFDYGLQSYDLMKSRSGFSVAYNYRTGRIRFLWKEQ